MICRNLPFGQIRARSCVPTLPALRYLNCITAVGWHNCNSTYCMDYPDGIRELIVIYTVGGAGTLETEKGTFALCPDSIILVPPHTPMKYFTDKQAEFWEFYWVDLTGDRILSLAERLCRDGYGYLRELSSHARIFEELLNEPFSEVKGSALIGDLFDKMIAEEVFEENISVANQILKYFSEHYTEHIDLRHMSELFFFSQNQIIRIVRNRTGYTPHEYLTRLRLTKACELLQYTALPIGEIGKAIGYGNNSHFSAAFRRLYGISPAEYRSRFSEQS